jgi:hypothetical protein
VTFYKLQCETGLCHATIHAIIHEDLKMKSVCTLRATGLDNQKKKQMQVQKCHELLTIHSEDLDGFFAKLVTGDQSRLHHHS